MKKEDLFIVGEFAVKITFIFAIIYVIYDAFYVFMPIALSVFFAVILYPFVQQLKEVTVFGKTIRMPETIAIILVILLFLLMLVVLVIFVVAPFLGEINNLMIALPQFAETIRVIGMNMTERFQMLNLSPDITKVVQETFLSASDYAISFVKGFLTSTFVFAQNILGFLIMPILLFYFLQDGKSFSKSFVKLLPRRWQNRVSIILHESAYTLSAYVRGIILIGIFSGLVIGLGTNLIGLQYSLVFGILAMVSEAVPIVGPIICTIPALLFAALQGPEIFVIVAIFYFVYYKIDAYIIAPKVTGKLLSLHPVVIIISILIGGKLAGVFGMLFSVPAAALIRVLGTNLIDQEEHLGEGDDG